MMKQFFLGAVALFVMTGSVQAQNKPAIPRDAKLEAKIEKTLAKMTLDEKIGQMLELNLDIMGKYDANRKWQLNETMLDTCISKWKVGSILNAPGTRAATIEQWQYPEHCLSPVPGPLCSACVT